LGAFNGLTKLTKFFMRNNGISDILPGTFDNMSSLEYIDVSYNTIKHLNRSVFTGLGAFNGLTNLTKLLMQHNEISDIIPGTAENMSSLEYLDLSYNRIKQLNRSVFNGLGAFKSLTKLTKLFMHDNEISDILPGTFENMRSLEYLDISYNRIKHLNRSVISLLGAFNVLTKLTDLFMRSNGISDILPGFFRI
jgi:peroxidase